MVVHTVEGEGGDLVVSRVSGQSNKRIYRERRQKKKDGGNYTGTKSRSNRIEIDLMTFTKKEEGLRD